MENVRNIGMANGKPAILVTITKQPGANVIQVVDNIASHAARSCRASLPPAIDPDR